jgi:hypothetical protein
MKILDLRRMQSAGKRNSVKSLEINLIPCRIIAKINTQETEQGWSFFASQFVEA